MSNVITPRSTGDNYKEIMSDGSLPGEPEIS